MSELVQTGKHIKGKDTIIVFLSFFIGILCTVVIPVYGHSHLVTNSLLLKSIPFTTALYLLVLPFFMYRGIALARATRAYHEHADQRRNSKQAEASRIRFKCFYRPNLEGTDWMITNRNNFSWHHAKLIIERTANGQLSTEKFDLGELPPLGRVTVQASLTEDTQVRWRVMIITQDGKRADLPTRWQQCDIDELMHI